MSTDIDDLVRRRSDLIEHALRLTNVGCLDSDDGRQWDIIVRQMRMIGAEINRLKFGPEEDDEPGGDIDWGDGGPLDAQ